MDTQLFEWFLNNGASFFKPAPGGVYRFRQSITFLRVNVLHMKALSSIQGGIPFPLPKGMVMHDLWFELRYYCDLSLGEQRNMLLARRQMLFEQQDRLEQHQQELEARQMRLEQQQCAFNNQMFNCAQNQEEVSAYHPFGSFLSCPLPIAPK